jgi:hypothetical protein
MKRYIFSVLLIVSLFFSGKLFTHDAYATLIAPGIQCYTRDASNNTFNVELNLPPQYSAPGFEVAALNGTVYSSGYMGYHAIAPYIPPNTIVRARVADGHGNWSSWSNAVTCYHSTAYAINLSCGSNNPTFVTMSWSPNYMANSTGLYDQNNTHQIGYHQNGSEGISSPDVFVGVARNYSFTARLQVGGNTYYESSICL